MSDRPANRIVTELEHAGVRLWVEGDRLRFRAPRGVLTEELRGVLRRNRDELLAHLRRDELPAVTPDPGSRLEPFPLTDVQAAYLLGRHDTFDLGGVGCHSYFELAFDSIDAARLAAAWRRVVNRHDMLRAVMHHDGHQRVLADVPAYRIPVVDQRSDPQAAQSAVLRTRSELDHTVYDPSRWPLFELRLTLCPSRAILHLSLDMLIADFTSIQVLLADLNRYYTDPDVERPALEIGFRDCVLAERRLRHSGRYELDRAYWWERVDTLPPCPELPLTGDGAPVPERPTPGERTPAERTPAEGAPGERAPGKHVPAQARPRFRRHAAGLPPAAWQTLRANARRHGITPSTVVLGAFAEVLSLWSRRTRFTVNVTLDGRRPLHPQVTDLVGDFTTVVPLDIDSLVGDTFAARVWALSAQLFADLDHRTCSGVEVLREVARRRGAAEALMPVVFTSAIGLTDSGAEHGALTDGIELVYGISQTPQVWLDCQVLEHRGALVVNWDVRDGVFPDGLVEDAFTAFSGLLTDLAALPGSAPPGSALPGSAPAGTVAGWETRRPIQLPDAQTRRRAEVNDTAMPRLDGALHDPVLAQARRTPDRPAVITDTAVTTYRQLLDRAEAVAADLRATGGAPGPGAPPVAVLMSKGPDQIGAVLGVLLAGRAYLPVDAGQPPVRRDAILADAGVRTVLVDQGRGGTPLPAGIRAIIGGELTSDELPGESTGGRARRPASTVSASSAGADEPAYVIYTSGSTGAPKGVVISHRGARVTIDDILGRFGIGPADRVLGLANLDFDLSVFDIFGTLATGAGLVLPDPARRGDPAHWAELAARHGVTVWNSVPAQLQMLVQYLRANDPEAAPDLVQLRLAMLSGDWIPVTLPGHVRALLPGVALHSLGGATEASIWSIHYPIDQVPDGWRSIPYGMPLANQRWHVRDELGRDRPDWVPGELYIGGAGVALGYLGDPARTAERFSTDPDTGERLYRTGDLGRYLPGGVIEFLGREDLQVKIRGHRIELAEVEAALAGHAEVGAAAVTVAGDRGLDRRLVAFVTPTTGTAAPPMPSGPLELESAAAAAAAQTVRHTDTARITRFADEMDEVALLAMARALGALGLFAAVHVGSTEGELLAASGAVARNHRLLRRWLHVLEERGRLRRDADGRLRGLEQVDEATLRVAWARLEDSHRGLDDGAELIRFLRRCHERLPLLVRGQDSALALLFPEGGMHTAEAAYRDNLISRYVNRAAATVLAEIAHAHPGPGPLRVLEVGAGVGGTTSEVVPAIAGFEVDYLFTDLSRFFLTEARQRFGDHRWVRYGLFDLNADPAAQGMRPGSFDVVLCANVLHNALSAGRVVRALRALLTPGGRLVVIETTRENYQVMTSMEFLMTFDEAARPDFDDARRGRDRIFLDRAEWLEVLDQAGGTAEVCLPPADDPLDRFGQVLFTARFGTVNNDAGSPASGGAVARRPGSPDPAALRAYLSELLPEYMVPARIEVDAALPLTANGKVDRAALHARTARPGASALSRGEPPRDDLERRIARLWAQLLGTAAVSREDDFFQLGGDSLLLSQLAGRLRSELPESAGLEWEDLVPALLAQPTVAGLAARLRRSAAAQAAPASPLLRLGDRQAAADGSACLLVHDGSGTLLPYQPLVQELAAHEVPLLGLAVADVDGYLRRPRASLIDDLAAEYADVLAAAGTGRLDVVGYCMGGMIATELARRLPDCGVVVASLTVISSHRVPYLVEDELLVEYGFARIMGLDPARLGLPANPAALGRAIRAVLDEHGGRVPAGALADLTGTGATAAAAAAMREYGARPRADRLAALTRELVTALPRAAEAGALAEADPERAIERSTRLLDVFTHSINGVAGWTAAPYPGEIRLVQERSRMPFLPDVADGDHTVFWRELCAEGVSVVEVPGDHTSCMRAPQVTDVAAAVMAARADSQ